jgi:ABC-type lipoprotein export system ATPase subunit
MNSDTVIVQTTNLTKIYGEAAGVHALDNVSMQMKKGEFLVIRGPSGSGKSSLLNIIGTLDQATSGEVIIEDVNILKLKGNALANFRREKIGFVFQMFYLIPTMTVLENVMLPLLPYRRKLSFILKDRAKLLLARVGLEKRLDHLPGQLSGGEQQRTAVARALINSPHIVLADEPTGNLDSEAGKAVLQLMQELNRERGITFVVATHDPSLVKEADRTIYLKDGKLE